MINEITEFLDEHAKTNEMFKHYTVCAKCMFVNNIILIKVPGSTVGNIFIDKDNVITAITINTNYCVEYTDDNIEDMVNDKFVGQVYDLGKYRNYDEY